MDADKINAKLTNISNASADQVSTFLSDYVFTTWLGTTTGFWVILLKPIVDKVIDLVVDKLFAESTLAVQKQVDIVEGCLIIKEVEKAVEEHDEDAYIDAIGKY